jgi:hypothetical protein
MATLKQAHKAREKHYRMLEKLGAHSLGVDEVGKKDSGDFAVIAFVEKENKKMPGEVEITEGKKKVKVKVKVKPAISDKFKAE